MNTRTLLDFIKADNYNIYANIESLKAFGKRDDISRDCFLAELRGFLSGLVLTGYITETSRRTLFSYMTL